MGKRWERFKAAYIYFTKGEIFIDNRHIGLAYEEEKDRIRIDLGFKLQGIDEWFGFSSFQDRSIVMENLEKAIAGGQDAKKEEGATGKGD